jgi:hypothetical protein
MAQMGLACHCLRWIICLLSDPKSIVCFGCPWINIDIETLSHHKDEITSMMMQLFAFTSNEDGGHE